MSRDGEYLQRQADLTRKSAHPITMMTQLPGDEDLFAGALAMPAAERSRYIERACAADSVAFNRLTALLDSYDDAVNFVAERCVEQIGAYRLLRELGEGGYGAVVSLAKYENQVRSVSTGQVRSSL